MVAVVHCGDIVVMKATKDARFLINCEGVNLRIILLAFRILCSIFDINRYLGKIFREVMLKVYLLVRGFERPARGCLRASRVCMTALLSLSCLWLARVHLKAWLTLLALN